MKYLFLFFLIATELMGQTYVRKFDEKVSKFFFDLEVDNVKNAVNNSYLKFELDTTVHSSKYEDYYKPTVNLSFDDFSTKDGKLLIIQHFNKRNSKFNKKLNKVEYILRLEYEDVNDLKKDMNTMDKYFDSISLKSKSKKSYNSDFKQYLSSNQYQKYYSTEYPRVNIISNFNKTLYSGKHSLVIKYTFLLNDSNNDVNTLGFRQIYEKRETYYDQKKNRFKAPKDTLFILLDPIKRDSVYKIKLGNIYKTKPELIDSVKAIYRNKTPKGSIENYRSTFNERTKILNSLPKIIIGSKEIYTLINIENTNKRFSNKVIFEHASVTFEEWDDILKNYESNCFSDESGTCGVGKGYVRKHKFKYSEIYLSENQLKGKTVLNYNGSDIHFKGLKNTYNKSTNNNPVTVVYISYSKNFKNEYVFKEVTNNHYATFRM